MNEHSSATDSPEPAHGPAPAVESLVSENADESAPPVPGANEETNPGSSGRNALDAVMKAHLSPLFEAMVGTLSENAENRMNEVDQVLKARQPGLVAEIVKGLRGSPELADPAAATHRLSEQLRVFNADFHRWENANRTTNRWLRRMAIAACVPLALLAGAAAQDRFEVLPASGDARLDPAWIKYGGQIRQCVAEAARRNRHLRCEIVVTRP